VLIFEDDFEFVVTPDEFWKAINGFFAKGLRYDVLMLSHLIKKSFPFDNDLVKVNEAQTASGYLVNSYFYDVIIDLYEKNLPILETTGKHWIYANDQIWKEIQASYTWYGFIKRLGRQRASFSDNSLEFMDRGF
jgi:hypothetical protein